MMRALDLEQSVWEEVTAILTNEEYLLDLGSEYLAGLDDPLTLSHDRTDIKKKLSALHQQKTRIVRRLAENDELDALSDALADIRAEERALEEQLEIHTQHTQLRVNARTGEQQLRPIAETARNRLADPTLQLMAEIYDSLELDLVRIASNRFEGTGSIPLAENEGDVWLKGPQRR